MAVAWGKKEAIIDSDCKVLVNLLQPDHANTNWTIQAIIDDLSPSLLMLIMYSAGVIVKLIVVATG
ncbi:hypothetical protein RHMOL_Rhmol08G0130500 [Rhododendron molle]|uniref:Uncharacterized protein n=1 Tax=Rhododendron molle TaxID=49168 RepID=A0ACC0MP52_RHOML|nr:hypothetical protein RHMOL_Rhmol08G0130500 [Rhododendron molle]